MEPIRIARGTGRGPTELSAYDAALADAGVHDYNLRQLSSVIPAGATIEEVGTAPDLGPGGHALHVVEASATGDLGPQSAVLAWARAEEEDADDAANRGDAGAGAGIFYEAGESEPLTEVRAEARAGIEAGIDLRERAFDAPETRAVAIDADDAEGFVAAVVIAAYGSAEPLLE